MRKINMQEVLNIQSHYTQDSERLIAGLESFAKELCDIINEDSFKGETAQGTKTYYDDVIVKEANNIKEAILSIKNAYQKDIEYFHEQVDKSPMAKIDQGYLAFCHENINAFMKRLSESSINVNSTIKSIYDISESQAPSFDKIEEAYFGMEKLNRTVQEDMGNFSTTNLDSAKADLDVAKSKLSQFNTEESNPSGLASVSIALEEFDQATPKTDWDYGIYSIFQRIQDTVILMNEEDKSLEDVVIDSSVESALSLGIASVITYYTKSYSSFDESAVAVKTAIDVLAEGAVDFLNRFEGLFGEGLVDDIKLIANEIWDGLDNIGEWLDEHSVVTTPS